MVGKIDRKATFCDGVAYVIGGVPEAIGRGETVKQGEDGCSDCNRRKRWENKYEAKREEQSRTRHGTKADEPVCKVQTKRDRLRTADPGCGITAWWSIERGNSWMHVGSEHMLHTCGGPQVSGRATGVKYSKQRMCAVR